MIIAALLIGYGLGILTAALCIAGRSEDDDLDTAHLGLFLVTDEEDDPHA